MENLIQAELREKTNRNKGNVCWLWTACKGDRAAKGKRLQSKATAAPFFFSFFWGAVFSPFFPKSHVIFVYSSDARRFEDGFQIMAPNGVTKNKRWAFYLGCHERKCPPTS